MDEAIANQYMQDLCEKYQLLYSNKKIIMSPDFEIRINTIKRNLYFYEYVDNSFFNHCSLNYTINGKYRCYNLMDKYKDFDELKDAIEYCINTILEEYKKVFRSKKQKV